MRNGPETGRIPRPWRIAALALSSALVGLAPSVPAGAGVSLSSQVGGYLARQARPSATYQGQPTSFLTYSGSTPNLSITAEAVLGLDAAGLSGSGAPMLSYLEAHAASYAHVSSSCDAVAYDDPGHLGLLLLIATRSGQTAAFASAQLRAQLVATQQSAGYFGSESPSGCYDGVDRTAFAVLGLRSLGVPASSKVLDKARGWLLAQQCGNGAFSAYRTGACNTSGYAADEMDTNSTALAVAALSSLGDATGASAAVTKACKWLASVQQSDGAWGFYPGDPSDSNSTSYVILGLRAAGQLSGSALANYTKGSTTPLQALARFVDPKSFGVVFQPGSAPDNLSTAEALLALSGLRLGS